MDDFELVEDGKEVFSKWLNEAVRGSGEGMVEVGKCYLKGILIQQNYDEAFKWFKKAASISYGPAFECLGDFYDFYLSDGQNARDCYEKGAFLKDANCMCKIAILYEREKKIYQAFYWYSEAIKLNHPKAYYRLGHIYIKGEGIIKDMALGYEYLLKAASLGSKEAKLSLCMDGLDRFELSYEDLLTIRNYMDELAGRYPGMEKNRAYLEALIKKHVPVLPVSSLEEKLTQFYGQYGIEAVNQFEVKQLLGKLLKEIIELRKNQEFQEAIRKCEIYGLFKVDEACLIIADCWYCLGESQKAVDYADRITINKIPTYRYSLLLYNIAYVYYESEDLAQAYLFAKRSQEKDAKDLVKIIENRFGNMDQISNSLDN